MPSQKRRLKGAPTSEQQDMDPLSFATLQGWTPGPLAILLTVVDLDRHVAAASDVAVVSRFFSGLWFGSRVQGLGVY